MDWQGYWLNTKHTPCVPQYTPELYGGSNDEPNASMGLACFLDPCKEQFKDGFSILDYGCGAGVMANFISARLEDFNYLGLEPKTTHGNERLALGLELFKGDKRINFGTIERCLENNLKLPYDCITLVSIFTHLSIEETYSILDNLIKVFDVNKNAKIIFSCFIANEYTLQSPEPHINSDFYGYVTITQQQLTDYMVNHPGLYLKRVNDFQATPTIVHNIFELGAK